MEHLQFVWIVIEYRFYLKIYIIYISKSTKTFWVTWNKSGNYVEQLCCVEAYSYRNDKNHDQFSRSSKIRIQNGTKTAANLLDIYRI